MEKETPNALTPFTHMDPEKHFIGETLAAPSVITSSGAAGLGSSPIPAREDHYHGIDPTVVAALATLANAGIYTTYVPTLGGSGWSKGNGVTRGRYTLINKFCHFRADFVSGSTSTYGTAGGGGTQLQISAPTAAHADINQTIRGWAFKSGGGVFRITGLLIGTMVYLYGMVSAIGQEGSFLSGAGTPFVWGTGDSVVVNGSYETT